MTKKIRTITVNQFDYLVRNVNDEAPELVGHLHQQQEFDGEGRMLKDAKYNRSEELEEMFEYVFNESGQVIREIFSQEEGEAAETKTFEYNAEGKLTRILKHYLDGSIDTTAYSYDDSGQLVMIERKNDENETEQFDTFEWTDGKLVKEDTFDGDKNPLITRSIKYDEKGNIIELLTWTAEEDTEILMVNEYDESGNLSGTKRYNSEGEMINAHIIQKDDDGRLISFTENTTGPRVQNQVTYNEKGKPVKEEEVTEEGDVLTLVERKYDDEDRELETEVFIDGQGHTLSRHYFLKYEYTFFEE